MTPKDKIRHFFNTYPGHLKTSTKTIADRLNVPFEDISEVRKEFTKSGFHSGSLNEDTLAQFLNENKIDERDVVNVYYKEKKDGVKFTVQTRTSPSEFDKEAFRDFLASYTYQTAPPVELPTNLEGVGVLNLMDAHIDKVSLVGTGGLEELQDNVDTLFLYFKYVAQDLIDKQVNTIIFPIGNDFFNTNGSFPSTKRGTFQPTTVRWQDAFQFGIHFYRQCIDFLANYCKVYVVNIPGNHDEDKIFYLGEVISALYQKHPNVICDLSDSPRKYVFINSILFGFGHGKVEKKKLNHLPSIMALECPYEWSEANHRVWLLGDIHHMEEYKMLSSVESFGVDVYFLRSASSTDEWHSQELWIGSKKSISSILFNKNNIKRNEQFIP